MAILVSGNQAPLTPGVAASVNPGYVWMISLVAALGGLLFGYDWVVIGGAAKFYEAFFHLSDTAASVATAKLRLAGLPHRRVGVRRAE